ncbi:hypothetical protein KZZ20_05850 [Methylacidiphilum fumariolicum]|uniref:hypothetical protein n=1 Tax=Candidatus Methylacidiphilum fumarolicum TaxID=591154 RepID=UPI001CA547B8|nr:hypothetical protein [Candidatus Methylacidiphilum fumarolicum]MBW6415036.1 hypothetical protein [Candidatus Methylacidiphilum fumarolicum]
MAEPEEKPNLSRKRARSKKQVSKRAKQKDQSQSFLLESTSPLTDLNFLESKLENLKEPASPLESQASQTSNIETEKKTEQRLSDSNGIKENPSKQKEAPLFIPPASSSSENNEERQNTTNSSYPKHKTPMNNPVSSSPVNHLKKTIEKQSKEQRSIQNILTVFLVGFIFFFSIVIILAVYGGMVIFKKIHAQDSLITDVDRKVNNRIERMASQVSKQEKDIEELETSLNQIHSYLTDTEKELSKTKDQIETLESKLTNQSQSLQQIASDLKQEKQNRIIREEALLKRVSLLEETQKQNKNYPKKTKSPLHSNESVH